MKLHQSVTAILLSLALCGGTAVSVAASTPAQEQRVLTTALRSINNPEGGFALPKTDRWWVLQPKTLQAGTFIVGNALEQILTGNADPGTMRRVLAWAPVVRDGDPLPPQRDFGGPEDVVASCFSPGITQLLVALKETETPGVYRFIVFYTGFDGQPYWTRLAVEYDSNTGLIHGRDNDGVFQIGYDYDIDQFLVKTAPDTWQKKLGYSKLYDWFAPLLSIYIDTLRFPFQFDGKDWMVQLWKGVYSVSNGAEIGLYEKPAERPFFWDGSATNLDMSMRLYRGKTLLYDYGTQHTWWTGGFHYGNPLLLPVVPARSLRLEGSIAFKNQGMLDAFLDAFAKNQTDAIVGSAQGLVFSFVWE
jgi:hypothetical protein